MPDVTFRINGQDYPAAQLLFAEVRQRVREGKSIPDRPNASVLSELRMFSRVAGVRAQAAADSMSAGLSRTFDQPRRQLSRSKRKVVATLSGVAIGAPASVGIAVAAGIAIGSNPVGWVIGGAMLFAAASALVGYSARHALRNARAWYYERNALPEFLANHADPAAADNISNDVANGVRYWLQKRKLSAIADDIRDLDQAFAKWRAQKDRPLVNCYDCVKVAQAFEQVVFVAIKLERDMKNFTKFFEWIQGQIRRVYVTSPRAFTDSNISAALKEAHAQVTASARHHHYCLNSGDASTFCCYRQNEDGKPIFPKVSTLRSLSAEMRQPFVRLTNDAAYLCQHGEDTAMAPYHDSADYIRDLLPQRSADTFSGLLNSTRSVAVPADQSLDDIGSKQPTSGWVDKMVTTGALSSLRGAASVGGKVGGEVVLTGKAAAELIPGAISGGIGAGIGLVRSAATAIAEMINTDLEHKALSEELAKGDHPDLNRMVIALRTILKDAHYFEKCVDELAKLRTYHDEFARTYDGGSMTCHRAFERTYRSFKAAKHARNLNLYYGKVKLFADQAAMMLNKVDADFSQQKYDQLCEEIRAAIANNQDHDLYCTANYCYAGRAATPAEGGA